MELESYIEPEEEVTEKIDRREKENLLRLLRRTHEGSLKAAEDILRYVQEKKLESPDRWLLKILEDLKPYENLKERARKLKNEATIMIKGMRLLNKRSLPIIIKSVDSQEVLEDVIKTYLKENENIPIPSDILRDAILTIKSWALKETLARRLLDQDTKDPKDLVVIEEELEDLEKFPEGSPLQLEALEKHWKIGMSTKDAVYIIGFIKSLADKIWQRLQKEGRIKELSIEDLWEIANYTDFQKIRKESARKGLKKAKGEFKRVKKILKINPMNGGAQRRFWKLEDLIEKFKEAIK